MKKKVVKKGVEKKRSDWDRKWTAAAKEHMVESRIENYYIEAARYMEWPAPKHPNDDVRIIKEAVVYEARSVFGSSEEKARYYELREAYKRLCELPSKVVYV